VRFLEFLEKWGVSAKTYEFVFGKRVADVTLKSMVVCVGRRWALDRNVAFEFIKAFNLDVIETWRYLQIERGLKRIFSSVLDRHRKLQSIAGAQQVSVNIAENKITVVSVIGLSVARPTRLYVQLL